MRVIISLLRRGNDDTTGLAIGKSNEFESTD